MKPSLATSPARCSRTAFWTPIAICCALLLPPAVGCGPSAADRLVGRWRGNLELNQEEVDRQRSAGESPFARGLQDFMLSRLKSMTMTLEFRDDGTMAMGVAMGPLQEAREGTWELVRHEADRFVIKSVEESGKQQEIVLTFEGPDSFLMEPLNGNPAQKLGQVRFQRGIEE